MATQTYAQLTGPDKDLGEQQRNYLAMLASGQNADATAFTLPVTAAPGDAIRATYSATILGLAVAALATDIFTITGSASKTVRINRVMVAGTQTAGAVTEVQLVKRSTADTGGTSTAPARVPLDSGDAAATAVVAAYTANPGALGTLVGAVSADKVLVPATTAQPDKKVWTFGGLVKPLVLRGAAEQLAVNLNGVTVTGGSFDITVEWTEA